jgi:hypothetical protein
MATAFVAQRLDRATTERRIAINAASRRKLAEIDSRKE